MRKLVLFIITLLFAGLAFANEELLCKDIDISTIDTDWQEAVVNQLNLKSDKVKKCTIGNHELMFSPHQDSPNVSITAFGRTILVKKHETHITDNNSNIISLGDNDQDMLFNSLFYSSKNCSNDSCTTVLDYDLDGDLDFKTVKNNDEQTAFIKISGVWYKKFSNHPNLTVSVNGDAKPIVRSKNGFEFK
ncbi:MAG: hypothetical protein GYB23_20520 [Vibrionaceae bacterium]|nr:hypothetical protein [Vibrionaceae bacterium]